MAERTAHVWVRFPDNPMPFAGLVLEWRQGEQGWQALVTYLDRMTLRHKVVTEWVPADQLVPVKSNPGTGSAYG
jgi:hypothetical protein